MNNPPSLFMRTTVWLVFLAGTGALADTPLSTQPSALLTESLALAKKRSDHGDARTTAALRLGATMRLAGMKDAAQQALEECIALNEKDSDPDYEREEVRIELAREFLLLGMVERARSILKEAKEGHYDYDLIGQELFARTALEMGDAAEAERAIHAALELAQRSGRKLTKTGNAMLCSLGRLALGLKKSELTRQAESVVKDEIWKSVMLGDQAVALAEQGHAEEAMRVAAPANDQHMAVLAHGRVAAAILERKESADAVVAALRQTAAKIKSAEARDFALQVATGKLAGAGGNALAVQIAAEIQSPVTRLLALCPVVEASSFDGLMSALIACPAEDQPALAEVLTSACGAKGLSAQSLIASAKVPQGWPRVRALCDAARRLMKTKSRDDAVKLLSAANAELSQIADAGWHGHARIQIALAAHQLGDVAMEEQQLKEACSEALRLDVAEDRRTALSQAVEAALLCGRKELAAHTLTEALHSNPSPAVRDTLVPMLIDAGQPDAALAEVTNSPLKDDFARRFVVYRLAKAGRLADAVDLAKKLPLRFQSEALADIALAQLKLPKPAVRGTRVVGLSLHGGWSSWVGQLEHMGVAWEVMPFSLPYLEGADGLAARYTMLGYPGAGDHHYQVSAAGEEHVRDYLREGGGMFGICAGQLLATGHQTGHQYMPSDFYYMRGQGAHQVQVAHQHPAGLGLPPVVIINRMNGDFMLPRPGCDVLGWYDKQNVCAAVSTAHYGLGRVAVSSPHPESGRELEPVDRVFIALTFWTMEGAQ